MPDKNAKAVPKLYKSNQTILQELFRAASCGVCHILWQTIREINLIFFLKKIVIYLNKRNFGF